MKTPNSSVQFLNFFMCAGIDFPSSGIDCSQRDPSRCFKCRYPFVYISRESVNDYDSSGHLNCRIIAVAIILTALLGLVTNSLIIIIIRRRNAKLSFDFLIRILSHIDTFCCLSCIAYSGAHVAYYDNLFGRGQGVLYWLFHASMTLLLWRVISMYLTLLISIERYLAIAYPLQSRVCYSLGKTKLQTVLVICLVSLVIIPGYFRVYVGPNTYGNQDGGLDVPSLRGYEYMFLPTRFYGWIEASDKLVIFIYLLQYWIPVPAMLILNLFTYRKVKALSRIRQQLTSSQRKELQPAQMFIPVVIVFLCTNMWPLIMLVTIHIYGVNFKELWMSFILATAVNSSVNFWIYYVWGTAFRREAKFLFRKWPLFPSPSRIYSQREST